MYISAVQSSADLIGCLFSTRSSGGNAFGDPLNFQGLWQRFDKTEVGAALSTVLDWRCYMVGWFGLLQEPGLTLWVLSQIIHCESTETAVARINHNEIIIIP